MKEIKAYITSDSAIFAKREDAEKREQKLVVTKKLMEFFDNNDFTGLDLRLISEFSVEIFQKKEELLKILNNEKI